jgi:hypothetical protein
MPVPTQYSLNEYPSINGAMDADLPDMFLDEDVEQVRLSLPAAKLQPQLGAAVAPVDGTVTAPHMEHVQTQEYKPDSRHMRILNNVYSDVASDIDESKIPPLPLAVAKMNARVTGMTLEATLFTMLSDVGGAIHGARTHPHNKQHMAQPMHTFTLIAAPSGFNKVGTAVNIA